MNKIITSFLCRVSLSLHPSSQLRCESTPFCSHLCFPLLSSPLLPTPPSFPSFLPLLLSKIENRTAGNWRSLSLLRPSGFTMLLTAAHLQHTIFRFSFCLLFPLPSFSTSSSLSSTVNSTSPFWNWIFIRDGPGVPVVFMPPSSHQFSFLLSSLHFSPFSPLSPPVNYLLSVRLGQKLHFPPDGYKKKQNKITAVWSVLLFNRWKEKLRRSWSSRQCSSFSAVSCGLKVQDVLYAQR